MLTVWRALMLLDDPMASQELEQQEGDCGWEKQEEEIEASSIYSIAPLAPRKFPRPYKAECYEKKHNQHCTCINHVMD